MVAFLSRTQEAHYASFLIRCGAGVIDFFFIVFICLVLGAYLRFGEALRLLTQMLHHEPVITDAGVVVVSGVPTQLVTAFLVSFILVPNGAVNRDNDGYFLNQIRRRQGILGTEFYTIRQDIFIGGSDSTHTAVIRGIQTFEPIAVLSDRPFTHGQTIRLQNEGDLFVR